MATMPNFSPAGLYGSVLLCGLVGYINTHNEFTDCIAHLTGFYLTRFVTGFYVTGLYVFVYLLAHRITPYNAVADAFLLCNLIFGLGVTFLGLSYSHISAMQLIIRILASSAVAVLRRCLNLQLSTDLEWLTHYRSVFGLAAIALSPSFGRGYGTPLPIPG